MGGKETFMANLETFKWELFCTWIASSCVLNGGDVAFAIGILFFYAAGKADVNFMVTLTKTLLTKDYDFGVGIVRLLGQVAGGFIAAVIQRILSKTCVGPGLVAASAGADSPEMASLIFDAIGTGAFLVLFFHIMSTVSAPEAQAFGYALLIKAFAWSNINPAFSIGTHLLANSFPSAFWAIWLGPVIGMVVYALFTWLVTGEKPEMFNKCCGGGGGGGGADVAPAGPPLSS